MATKRTDVSVVTFDGPATIRGIDALHARLFEALEQNKQIRIDAKGLTEVDMSFIQLVLAARKSALRDGKQFELSAPAEGALHDTLILGGFIAPDEQVSPERDFWLKRETVQ